MIALSIDPQTGLLLNDVRCDFYFYPTCPVTGTGVEHCRPNKPQGRG